MFCVYHREMILALIIFLFGHCTLGIQTLRSQRGIPGDAVAEVNDVADFAFPTTNYSISVPERIQNNSFVGRISINNANNHPNVTYRLRSSGSQLIGPFRVTSGGFIYTSGFLDRELVPAYSFDVQAVEDGVTQRSAILHVYVNVVDVNDNTPHFDRNAYVADIRENALIGSYVIRVSATDADYGANARISYHLSDGNGDFGINETTGQIFTRTPLDREMIDRYQMTVRAADQGIPSLTGTATVLVR